MKTKALQIAHNILQQEREFFELSKRHTGIIHAHSELWCEKNFEFDLSKTGVSAGADAIASPKSPVPFKVGDSIQIKGRDEQTMHVSFKHPTIDWLIVVAYGIYTSPVMIRTYIFKVATLLTLASKFENEAGSAVIPLRVKGDVVRLEWMHHLIDKTGPVKGSNDTWDARGKRFKEILKDSYQLKDGKIIKGG